MLPPYLFAPLLPLYKIMITYNAVINRVAKQKPSIRTKYKDLQFTVGLFFVILILKYI